MQLVLHPGTTGASVPTIDAAVWQTMGRWHFRFLIEGADEVILPDLKPAGRTDELWRRTCFEAFVSLTGGPYIELNFSPSSQWAVYRFERYRSGMREQPAEIGIWLDAGESWVAVEASVKCEALVAGSTLGLSAVIEERDGTSYWALGHPDGPPDFHDRACFLARLPE